MGPFLIFFIIYRLHWIAINTVQILLFSPFFYGCWGSVLHCILLCLSLNDLFRRLVHGATAVFLKRRFVRIIEDTFLTCLLVLNFQKVVINHFFEIALSLVNTLVPIIDRYCLVSRLRSTNTFWDDKLEIVASFATIKVF